MGRYGGAGGHGWRLIGAVWGPVTKGGREAGRG